MTSNSTLVPTYVESVTAINGANRDADAVSVIGGILQKIFDPELACYLAGVDVLATDRFGKLGCLCRDAPVWASWSCRCSDPETLVLRSPWAGVIPRMFAPS